MTKTKANFVHLHNHSEFSLLDGASRIADLVAAAKDMDMPAVALTDHGNMYAAIAFYSKAVEQGIKPIIGCEMYLAPRTRHDKETKEDRSPGHLTILAKNQEGYKNLLHLVSIASLEGFYNRPRIDKEVLFKYAQGLIVMSGCPAGEMPRAIMAGDIEKARKIAAEYKEVWGLDFYLEVQDYGLPEQKDINAGLCQISKDLGIGLAATNDTHYIKKDDALTQDIMLCIQTGKTLEDKDRMRFEPQEFYFKTPELMREIFKEMPEACDNTLEIAEKIDLKIELGKLHLPDFKVPEGETPNSYMTQKVWEGIKERYAIKSSEGKDLISPEIKHRVETELAIIEKMNYSAYFLIVQDFISYARSKGILVGPGRGSAAGSIISYALGITNVDPLKYGLLFERFLNPERISMPDIDIDFCYERRGEVIEYVNQKYGQDRVAQIITFGTMAARAAIRDGGRVLGIPLPEVDKVAKMIPLGPDVDIESSLKNQKDLKELYDTNKTVKELLDNACRIEGLARHASVHAAGVVISEKPLTEYAPLQRLTDNQVVTQYPMEDLEKIGLLKMDFLGLRNLTMIDHSVKIIKRIYGVELDMDKIPMDDLKTYQLLSAGDTIGVFQLESRGMRGIIKDLKPNTFEEIIALLALYRPGPLESGMVEDFVKRKHKLIPVKYDLPQLEPILRETHGVILYQEQVMQIASRIAGFTLGQADILRRAMGKKKASEMKKIREDFVNGAVARNVSHNKAVHLFNLCEKFAGYGFNKSHSTAYGIISYQTAYLKANYPVEFMAALLSSVMGNTDKVTLYMAECQRMNIKILPPDVNESMRRFTVVSGGIRFGLSAIKNVGDAAIQSILQTREAGKTFKSLKDFCSRVDLRVCNKRVMESLIKAGAMDSLGKSRAYFLSILAKTVDKNSASSKKNNGQSSLFDDLKITESSIDDIEPELAVEDFSPEENLRMEKELLGLYISGHPLAHVIKLLEQQVTHKVLDVAELKEGQIVKLGGILVGCRRITTKKGDPMLIGNIEDLTGTVPIVVFPKSFEKFSALLSNDAIVLLKGKVNRDMRTDDNNIIVENVEQLDEGKKERCLHVDIDGVEDKGLLDRLKGLLLTNRGAETVYMHTHGKIIEVPENMRVEITPYLVSKIEQILGTSSARIEFRPARKIVEPEINF